MYGFSDFDEVGAFELKDLITAGIAATAGLNEAMYVPTPSTICELYV